MRLQQVEVRLEQAAVIQEQIERQIKCMATAVEAVVQLTAAKARFPALRRLTLGAAESLELEAEGDEDCVLDGAALSAALAAAPLGLLEHLALPSCRLNDAVVRQLDDSLSGKACRLDLGLHLVHVVHDDADVGDSPLLQPQLTLLCQGGGWQANLHSLSLAEYASSPLSRGLVPLSTLTALRELTLDGRSIDSDAGQVLGGLTQLVTLRAMAWAERAAPVLPTSLRHLELLGDFELGKGVWGGAGAIQDPDELHAAFSACCRLAPS